MPAVYLTPAALGYLAQFILALLITGYFVGRLLPRHADRPAHRLLLTGFLACVAALTLLLALEAATSPADRLYFLFPQTTVLALGILLLLQFAYRFPEPLSHKIPIGRGLHFDRCKWEALLVLVLSLLYLWYEAAIAVIRYQGVIFEGVVTFRVVWADYPMAAGLLWAPIVFLRQSLAAANPSGLRDPKGFLRALWRPQGQPAITARVMALVYLLPFAVGLLSIARSDYNIPQELLQISRSLGIMVGLAAFAVVYLNYLPETTSFMVRLVGISLVTLLIVTSALGWLAAPAYAAQFHPALPDQHTLRFAPNAAGGYDVSLAPLHFETDPSAGSPQTTRDDAGQGLGVNLHLPDQRQSEIQEGKQQPDSFSFIFPYYGQIYDRLYVSDDGTIALGHELTSYFSYALRYGGSTPVLLPLLLDLNPGSAGGDVFVRQETDRLIVTWQRVPGFYRRADIYTFQAVLYTDGVFEFSYNGLPANLTYHLDDEPSASAWAIGAAPGDLSRSPQLADWGRLAPDGAAAVSGGPQGIVHDYYLDFRRYLHTLLLPLAYLMLGASLLVLVVFPALFQLSLVRPLNTLLAGVRRVNTGDLETTMPIQYRDEIGFLTESFNHAVTQQRDLIATLEERVIARTADLTAANAQLRHEMDERQAAQAQVLLQERALAAAEEREQLGRELHDGLGQVMGYVNVQAQTVETLLDQGKLEGALTNLRQMARAAQDAHTDLRSFILGFRAAARRSFGEALQGAVAEFERQAAIPVAVEKTQPWDERWLSPVAEVHLLRIIQEALTNVYKHAQAKHVTVSLAQAGERLRVTVADDGVGFRIADFGLPISEGPSSAIPLRGTQAVPNPQSPIPNPQSPISNHFGLGNMRERAVVLCGTLTVESAPGQGTRVILECPIQTPCEAVDAPALPLRVLLVDDHPMFLDGLRNLLTAHGMEVVGLGQDGLEAQTLARALRPDLIVMDLQMPGCDGLEATRRIKAEWPEARIVVLTVSAAEEHLFAALEAGAAGYLLKNLDAEEFLSLLAGLEQGAPPIAPELAARIQGELGQAASMRGQTAALSPEQTNVLRLVAQGLTYREVGRQLHLTEAGVKYQMKQILERLHLANRSQVEAYARRSGLGG